MIVISTPVWRSCEIAAEASCPPAPDHLLVPPVGAAWIGGSEGAFPTDGGPDIALWSVDEVLVGSIPVVEGQLIYVQPTCDPIVAGGIGNRFLVTTADPASPTLANTVMWQIGADDHVSPMLIEADAPSVYDVSTLAAARALVLSGDMPVGASPTPAPVCSLDLASPPPPGASTAPQGTVTDAGTPDRQAARAALEAYYAEAHAHRFEQAWERLSPDAQSHWDSFESFQAGAANAVDRLGRMTTGPDALCLWLTDPDSPHHFGDADLDRAWLIEVTHGPGSNTWSDHWIVAPLPDGTWSLWQVR